MFTVTCQFENGDTIGAHISAGTAERLSVLPLAGRVTLLVSMSILPIFNTIVKVSIIDTTEEMFSDDDEPSGEFENWANFQKM